MEKDKCSEVKLPKLSIIKEFFDYNPDTGIFKWAKNKGKMKAGSIAGNLVSDTGYWKIRFNKQNYLAHRLAFYIMTGEYPEGMDIDHINGDRSDNRWCNLRKLNRSDNVAHRKVCKNYICNRNGRFTARIHVNYQNITVGTFDTPEEATAAALFKKKELRNL